MRKYWPVKGQLFKLRDDSSSLLGPSAQRQRLVETGRRLKPAPQLHSLLLRAA